MSQDRLYLEIAVWSQVVSSIVFIAAIVFLWFKWILPVLMDAQARSNEQIAEAERHRDEVRGALEALRTEIESARHDAELIEQRAGDHAERERDATVAEATDAGERVLRDAGKELDRARAAARLRLRSELLERALQVARARCSTDRRTRARRAFGRRIRRARWSTPPVVNATLARRYAIAVLSLAREQDAVERVGDDLATFAQALGEDGPARDFYVAPIIERRKKQQVLEEVFGGRVHDIALHTLLLLVRKRRETLLGAIAVEYRALERAAQGVELLSITSARKLDRDELGVLVERLERIYGKKFRVTETVDPALIGGVRIMMGDRRIDGTISGRLDALARELFATN